MTPETAYKIAEQLRAAEQEIRRPHSEAVALLKEIKKVLWPLEDWYDGEA